jgi:hypothetical protein
MERLRRVPGWQHVNRAAELAGVTQRFARASNAVERQIQGAGLGLGGSGRTWRHAWPSIHLDETKRFRSIRPQR